MSSKEPGGCKMGKRGQGVWVFISEKKLRELQAILKNSVLYVWYYLPSGLKIITYVQVLTKDFPKSNVHLGVPQAYVLILFVGIHTMVPLRTSSTKDKSVCMVCWTYVWFESPKFSKCPPRIP